MNMKSERMEQFLQLQRVQEHIYRTVINMSPQPPIDSFFRTVKWVSKDNTVRTLQQMTTNHLQNTINLIGISKRRNELNLDRISRDFYITNMQLELEYRQQEVKVERYRQVALGEWGNNTEEEAIKMNHKNWTQKFYFTVANHKRSVLQGDMVYVKHMNKDYEGWYQKLKNITSGKTFYMGVNTTLPKAYKVVDLEKYEHLNKTHGYIIQIVKGNENVQKLLRYLVNPETTSLEYVNMLNLVPNNNRKIKDLQKQLSVLDHKHDELRVATEQAQIEYLDSEDKLSCSEDKLNSLSVYLVELQNAKAKLNSKLKELHLSGDLNQ